MRLCLKEITDRAGEILRSVKCLSWGSEFRSLEPTRKPQVLGRQRLEDPGILPASQPRLLVNLGPLSIPVSKEKVENNRERHSPLTSDLYKYIHVHTHTHAHMYACTHTCTHLDLGHLDLGLDLDHPGVALARRDSNAALSIGVKPEVCVTSPNGPQCVTARGTCCLFSLRSVCR